MPEVLQEDAEVKGVGGEWLEPERAVTAGGVPVRGVHDQSPPTDCFGGVEGETGGARAVAASAFASVWGRETAANLRFVSRVVNGR
jgi:hypothetical protein